MENKTTPTRRCLCECVWGVFSASGEYSNNIPRLHYHDSETVFLCVFREIVFCAVKAMLWKSHIQDGNRSLVFWCANIWWGLFLKGRTYIIPSNQYLTAAMGMAVAKGYHKAHGNNGL